MPFSNLSEFCLYGLYMNSSILIFWNCRFLNIFKPFLSSICQQWAILLKGVLLRLQAEEYFSFVGLVTDFFSFIFISWPGQSSPLVIQWNLKRMEKSQREYENISLGRISSLFSPLCSLILLISITAFLVKEAVQLGGGKIGLFFIMASRTWPILIPQSELLKDNYFLLDCRFPLGLTGYQYFCYQDTNCCLLS